MKVVLSISVEEDLKENFIKYCDDNFINKSAIIEDMMDQFLTTKLSQKEDELTRSLTGGINNVKKNKSKI
jgi:hypothetical protein